MTIDEIIERVVLDNYGPEAELELYVETVRQCERIPTVDDLLDTAASFPHFGSEQIIALMHDAIRAERARRGGRIVVSTRDGVRTWVGGDTVADLHKTIGGYLEDGYELSDLIIEGILEGEGSE